MHKKINLLCNSILILKTLSCLDEANTSPLKATAYSAHIYIKNLHTKEERLQLIKKAAN